MINIETDAVIGASRIVDMPIFWADQGPLIDQGELAQRQNEFNLRAHLFDTEVGGVYRQAIADPRSPRERLSNMPDISIDVRKHVELLLNVRDQLSDEKTVVKKIVETDLAQVGKDISNRLLLADLMTTGKSVKEQIACRVAAMGGKLLPVLDFDKTTTIGDDHIGKLPTKELERLLDENKRSNFLDPFLTTMYALMAEKNLDWMRDVGRHYVLIRPGTNDFVVFSRKSLDVRPLILSQNFDKVIYGGLDNIPSASGNVRVMSITERSVITTEKGLVLKYLARTNPNRAVAYGGDGLTDGSALDAKDNTAFYLAVRGDVFERLCAEAKVPYIAFGDFTEILEHVNDIMSIVPKYTNAFDQAPSI